MSKSEIKKIIPLIILFLLAMGLIWMIMQKNTDAANNEYIITEDTVFTLYSSPTCPHCQIIKEYIKTSKIDEKINLEVKNVQTSLKNQDELVSKAKICKLDTKRLGIPLLFDGKNCYSGDTDIVSYFETLK